MSPGEPGAMPISPGPPSAVNSLMKMDSPLKKRLKPPRSLVFIFMWVSMVAMEEASTLRVSSAGTFTVRKE